MPSVNNAEALRTWFMDCPALNAGSLLSVDYFSGKPVEYSLFSVPSAIKYHENILGEKVPDSLQTVDYIFASTESYGSDASQNMINLGFYQDVIAWILTKNAAGSYPDIDEGSITSIVPTLTGYPIEMAAGSARYQINLKITYRFQLTLRMATN